MSAERFQGRRARDRVRERGSRGTRKRRALRRCCRGLGRGVRERTRSVLRDPSRREGADAWVNVQNYALPAAGGNGIEALLVLLPSKAAADILVESFLARVDWYLHVRSRSPREKRGAPLTNGNRSFTSLRSVQTTRRSGRHSARPSLLPTQLGFLLASLQSSWYALSLPSFLCPSPFFLSSLRAILTPLPFLHR